MGFAGVEYIRHQGFILSMSFIVLVSFATSVLQGSTFGFAGQMPPKYTQAVMGGNGFAGLIVSIIRIITKALTEGGNNSMATVTLSTSTYFFACCATLLLCLISFIVLLRFPFVEYYMNKSNVIVNDVKNIQYEKSEIEKNDNEEVSIFQTFKKIWVMGLSIVLCFLITIGIFPGLALSVKSVYGPRMESWLPVIMITTFNLFDFLGRSFPRIYVLPRKLTIIFNISRIIFLPLFILCVNPPILRNDIVAIIIMIFFAFSNGYLSSCIMMYGPENVNDNEKVAAGTIMTFLLVFGITMGGNIGIVINEVFIKNR